MGTAAGKVVIGGGSTSSGTVSKVTSTGGTVNITNATGPTVNLEVASGEDGINQLTGDVTAGPGVGSQAATLASVATAQTTGDAAHAPTITIDAKGRVTTLVNNLISITVSQISNLASTLAGYLQLAGGTMSGAIAMGANKITGLANGSAAQDAAAFGQIPVLANGYGVTGNTGATPTPAVGLTTASGILSAALNPVPTSLTTLLTTSSLGVGTWLLSVNAIANAAAYNTVLSLKVAVGTATATFAGPSGSDVRAVEYNETMQMSFTCIVTVTVAGTLLIQTQSQSASIWSIQATDSLLGESVTGYTAVRIA